MVVCRAKDNQKIQKTFTTKYILTGLSEWSSQAFHFMKPFLAMRKGGDSYCRDPVFFDPADAVSDPKKVRIWGNPTHFSLFFLTPQMQSLTLKRYVFWEIQLAFPCFLSEKRAKESSLFVNKSKYTSNQETTFGLAAGDFAITIH